MTKKEILDNVDDPKVHVTPIYTQVEAEKAMEEYAIQVIMWLLDVNVNGIDQDRFHKIIMCDGDLYWETDKDGDESISAGRNKLQ